MPQLAPRVLKNAMNADQTYDVSTFVGNKTTFVNVAAGRFSEQSVLTETTRPSAAKNDGHKLSASLALPHPVVDQDGCCVNKDATPSSFFSINTLASKFATDAQKDDLVALIRSYVQTSEFAALVKGGNNW